LPGCTRYVIGRPPGLWLRRLDGAQRRELEQATVRARKVARWFVVVYAAGLLLASGFFFLFYVPALTRLLGWLAETLLAAPCGAPSSGPRSFSLCSCSRLTHSPPWFSCAMG
jgi:hypothetical protein